MPTLISMSEEELHAPAVIDHDSEERVPIIQDQNEKKESVAANVPFNGELTEVGKSCQDTVDTGYEDKSLRKGVTGDLKGSLEVQHSKAKFSQGSGNEEHLHFYTRFMQEVCAHELQKTLSFCFSDKIRYSRLNPCFLHVSLMPMQPSAFNVSQTARRKYTTLCRRFPVSL